MMKQYACYIAALVLVLANVSCIPAVISEDAEIPPAPCEEMIPLCEEAGLSAEDCCDESQAGQCSGSVISLKISSGTMTSAVSAQDCLDQLDAVVDTYCTGANRPGNCTGPCTDPKQECQNAGEATDGQTIINGPLVWTCKSTKGRCYCACQ